MNPLTPLALAAVLAVIIERITGGLKSLGINGNLSVGADQIPLAAVISLVLGLVAAFAFNLDLFAGLGLNVQIPTLAVVLSGIVIGGGSQILHDVTSAFPKLGGPQGK